jgi:hypothetical protein
MNTWIIGDHDFTVHLTEQDVNDALNLIFHGLVALQYVLLVIHPFGYSHKFRHPVLSSITTPYYWDRYYHVTHLL